jgi:hypothetical protein
MSRPYLYHYIASLTKGHELCLAITRKELDAAGFEIASKPVAWEQFAYNADTLLLVSCVPLVGDKTRVHVVGTSNSEASAGKWAADIMDKIKKSKMVLID